MSELLEHVDQSIRDRRLFLPRQRILVAVSGGVDSMVLLHLLDALARRHGWRLTVAHLNHRLRARSSDADERLVRRTAQRLKLPVVVERVAVADAARRRKVSVEMAARELRHSFLARTARRRNISTVALAHHADDQVELFFLRLLRGSGGEGLAGMRWTTRSPSDARIALVRPLLDLPKSALMEYAAENKIRYREDASNASPDFLRNRIRHELLPLLRGKYQPGLDRAVLRVMEIVGAEAELTGRVAREWMARGGSPKSEGRSPKEGRRPKAEDGGEGAGGQKRMPFDELPVAVQRRYLQLQLIGLGVVPDYELVERLRFQAGRAVAVGNKGAKGGQGAGMGIGGTTVLRCAVRDGTGRVSLQEVGREGFSEDSICLDLGAGKGRVEFAGARISWEIRRGAPGLRGPARAQMERFDADTVGSTIQLRHWQPGDRFQPIGMAQAVKLQDIFTNLKVPRAQRRRRIVATAANGEVFWVEGLRIGERFKLTKRANRHLQWRWNRF